MNSNRLMAVVVVASAVIAGLLGLNAPHGSAVPWLHLVVTVGLAVLFFAQVCRLARPARDGVAEQVLRPVRFWHALTAVSPAVQFLQTLALSIGLLGAAEEVVGALDMARICNIVFMALLFVAGVLDLIQRGTMLARRVWREILGKLFSVSFGAILLCLAISKAKTWIHSITHIDPKYLTEATAILAAILLPVMYSLFAVGLLYAFALLQLLGLLVYVPVTSLVEHSRTFIGKANHERLKSWWYRITTGTEPPDGVAPKKSIFDGLAVFVRPISTIAIIYVFTQAYATAKGFLPQLWPHMTTALVALEYRHGSSCPGFEKGVGVVYMEDGNISVVRQTEAGPVFSVESCKYQADAAGT